MAAHRTDSLSDTALHRLRWPLRLTRAGMLAERGLRAFWPLWSVGFVIWAALAFGLHETLSLELAWLAAVAAVAALLWALVRGLRRFRWPGRAEALDRLDASLPGRPITALSDTQAIGTGDAASVAVWRAHVAQMAERAAQARAARPDLSLARRDPYALRYVAATSFLVALLFGSIWRGASLTDLAPGPAGAVAAGPSYEGWVQPPLYTGKPTIYLNEAEGRASLSVPAGSTIILRLYGEVGALSVSETVSSNPLPGASSEPAQEFAVAQSGTLSLDGAFERSWALDVIPDTPPVVAMTGEVLRAISGEMRLNFAAQDDYGVLSGTATLTLDLPAVERRYGLTPPPEDRPAIVLDLPMPFAGNRADFEDTLVETLAEHPWADLPVTLTLRATDAAEQTGASAPEQMVLPGRRFFDPLAQAIIEQRRDLLWSRANGRRAAGVLRAVTWHPEDVFGNTRAYLLTRTAIRRLEAGLPDLASEVRDEVSELLWRAALLIEEGDVSDALARLRRAEERLSEAIRQGASPQEIAELMQEMREAMRDYMQALADEAERNPDQQTSQTDPSQTITSDQLQEMLNRVEELMREGRTAEAQQLLDQLRQMMENMRMAQGQPQQGQGQQSMQGLQDTLRQQQELSDDTFGELQEQFGQGEQPGQQGDQGQQGQQGQGQQGQGQPGGQQGQPGGRQGQGTEPGQGPGQMPGADELARRQQALRDMLRQQEGGLPGANTPEGQAARDALGRAGRAMDEAENRLSEGDLPGAIDEQANAMEALREGIRNLGEALAQQQQQGQGQQGQNIGRYDPNQRRDPLGRDTGNTGRIGTDENMLPGDDLLRRSRELMDEIRRRSSDRERPDVELDYLRRLLERF